MAVIFRTGYGQEPDFASAEPLSPEPVMIGQQDTGGGSDRPELRPTLLQLFERTTLPTVPGVGGGIDWLALNSLGVKTPAVSLVGEITGVNAGAEEGSLVLVAMHQGERCEVARIRGQTGQDATFVGNSLAVFGWLGGQLWARTDFLVSGKSGFGGVAPIAPPVLATGAGHTTDDVITALQSYGLVRQS